MQLGEIKGIGKKREALFQHLSIYSVEDLILNLPKRYEHRTLINPDEVTEDGYGVVMAQLKQVGRPAYVGGHRTIQRARFAVDGGDLKAVWFNQRYISNRLKPGETYCLYGLYQREQRQLINPVFTPALTPTLVGIEPVYALTEGISNKQRIGATEQAFALIDPERFEYLDLRTRQLLDLQPYGEMLRTLHFPGDAQSLYRAQRELALRRHLIDALVRQSVADARGKLKSPEARAVSFAPILERLPFELTAEQKRAVEVIAQDLLNCRPMNRLLQGDVGSGKTVVAFIAAYMMLQNGYKAVLMAPTEVLARQHFDRAQIIFSELGFPIWLLSGSSTARERQDFDAAATGVLPGLFVGTHALFQQGVQFERLGLVITDEQHRFGVEQRGQLQRKMSEPNTLVLTATPIPRTLSLVDYGDLEMTRIVGKPPGRQPIDTFIIDRRYEHRLFNFIAKEAEAGHQAYIVCPRIEETDSDLDAWSTERVHERLKVQLGNRVNAAVLHGRLSPQEKRTMIDGFSSGRLDVLISTTVIEVGIDSPNATVMAIMAAERFGLAQLHQLRGRVGRSSLKAYCALVLNAPSKSAAERLKVIVDTEDGYEIARKDLYLRGAGERYGLMQSGIDPAPSDWDESLAAEIERFLRIQGAAWQMPDRLREKVRAEFEAIRNTTLN